MKYVVLPAAQTDLERINDWITENFGESAALKAEADLFDTFELLAEYQDMGRRRAEFAGKPSGSSRRHPTGSSTSPETRFASTGFFQLLWTCATQTCS